MGMGDSQGHLKKGRIKEGYQWSEKSDCISAAFLPTLRGRQVNKLGVVAEWGC